MRGSRFGGRITVTRSSTAAGTATEAGSIGPATEEASYRPPPPAPPSSGMLRPRCALRPLTTLPARVVRRARRLASTPGASAARPSPTVRSRRSCSQDGPTTTARTSRPSSTARSTRRANDPGVGQRILVDAAAGAVGPRTRPSSAWGVATASSSTPSAPPDLTDVRGIDIFSQRADIVVMDMHAMTFPDASFDLVYSLPLARARARPRDVAAELVRVLRARRGARRRGAHPAPWQRRRPRRVQRHRHARAALRGRAGRDAPARGAARRAPSATSRARRSRASSSGSAARRPAQAESASRRGASSAGEAEDDERGDEGRDEPRQRRHRRQRRREQRRARRARAGRAPPSPRAGARPRRRSPRAGRGAATGTGGC